MDTTALDIYLRQLDFLHGQLEASLVTLDGPSSPELEYFYLTDHVYTISSYLLASYSAWDVLDPQYTFLCDLAFDLEEFLSLTHRDIALLKELLANFDTQIVKELHRVQNKRNL